MNTDRSRSLPNLRALIDDRGLRHQFVADRLGVTSGHLSLILDGKRRLTERHAEALERLLGLGDRELRCNGCGRTLEPEPAAEAVAV